MSAPSAPPPAKFLPWRRLLRFSVYGSLAAVGLLILLHPYLRQVVFGPKINDLPFCYWQQQFRLQADPDEAGNRLLTRVFEWLGYRWQPTFNGFPNEPEMLPVLLSLQNDPNPKVRSRLAFYLINHEDQPEAVPALVRLLEDRDPEVRRSAAFAASGFQTALEPLLASLTALLEEPDMRCRFYAARSLCALAKEEVPPQTLDILRAGISDADRHIRFETILCFGTIGPKSAIFSPLFPDFAEQVPRDPDRFVRFLGAECASRFGQQAVPLLMQLLDDPDTLVRRRAVLSLSELGTEAQAAIPQLVRLRCHTDEETRLVVEDALSRIDPRHEQHQPLSEPNP